MLAPSKYGDLDHFIAWLETKNPDETFNIYLPTRCVLGQYSEAYDQPIETIIHDQFDGRAMDIIAGIPRPPVQSAERIRFGDVLKRAKQTRGW